MPPKFRDIIYGVTQITYGGVLRTKNVATSTIITIKDVERGGRGNPFLLVEGQELKGHRR